MMLTLKSLYQVSRIYNIHTYITHTTYAVQLECVVRFLLLIHQINVAFLHIKTKFILLFFVKLIL